MKIKSILPFFSYLFHPLFIPLYAVICSFLLNVTFISEMEKYLLLIQVTILTVLIPICFYFLLRSLGRIDSMMVSELEQRKTPLALQGILIYVLLRQSLTMERIPELYFFFLGAFLAVLASLVFAFCDKKISLHMVGISGLLFFVIGLGFHNQVNINSTIAFLFVVTGIVASSRLHMKAHDFTELSLGFVTGMLSQIVLWQFWV